MFGRKRQEREMKDGCLRACKVMCDVKLEAHTNKMNAALKVLNLDMAAHDSRHVEDEHKRRGQHIDHGNSHDRDRKVSMEHHSALMVTIKGLTDAVGSLMSLIDRKL